MLLGKLTDTVAWTQTTNKNSGVCDITSNDELERKLARRILRWGEMKTEMCRERTFWMITTSANKVKEEARMHPAYKNQVHPSCYG